MKTITLKIVTLEEDIVLKYDNYRTAQLRFEQAKNLRGVQELVLTFPNGGVWYWTNDDMGCEAAQMSNEQCVMRTCGVVQYAKQIAQRVLRALRRQDK